MTNIIIPNQKFVDEIKKLMSQQKKEKIQVIADFDRTLTKAFYKNEKAPSIIAYLRNGKYLAEGYSEKAHELFDKYHPIEINPDYPLEKKKKKMMEWWEAHFDLLIKSGLNKKTIKKSVKDMIKENALEFREGVLDFLKFLKENNIPLIIMSSSIGNMIKEFLRQKKVYYNNIHVISNILEFDDDGNATGIKKIIHVFNKHEMELTVLPNYKLLLNRTNVILLGDSLGDIGMIEGFPYKNLIKIGFLNYNLKESKDDFEKAYDVVILNDGSFEWVNGLLKEAI